MKRRKFIQLSLACSLIPLVSRAETPSTLPALTEDDPTAKALGYAKSVESESVKGNTKYKAGSDCENCMFFKPDIGNGCGLFPGKSVEPKGWCSAWVAKPA